MLSHYTAKYMKVSLASWSNGQKSSQKDVLWNSVVKLSRRCCSHTHSLGKRLQKAADC